MGEAAQEVEELSEKEKEILRLKEAEKFIVRQTGKYECRVCAYVYDEAEQGTGWGDLSNSWRCPQCLSQKGVFTPKTETIAGFAENQQYGFGTNTLTAGDKNSLIFGTGSFLSSFSQWLFPRVTLPAFRDDSAADLEEQARKAAEWAVWCGKKYLALSIGLIHHPLNLPLWSDFYLAMYIIVTGLNINTKTREDKAAALALAKIFTGSTD